MAAAERSSHWASRPFTIAMSDRATKISREELYQRIWSTPFVRLAKELERVKSLPMTILPGAGGRAMIRVCVLSALAFVWPGCVASGAGPVAASASQAASFELDCGCGMGLGELTFEHDDKLNPQN